MIHIRYSVVYQMMLFLVLWLIVSKVLFRPYMELLEEREQKTTGRSTIPTDLEHEASGCVRNTKKKSLMRRPRQMRPRRRSCKTPGSRGKRS